MDTKCGWFLRLFELPDGTTEIPAQFRESYPTEPPFTEIAYRLEGRNHIPQDTIQHKPDDVHWLRRLNPEVQF